jgi:hypothetical protein
MSRMTKVRAWEADNRALNCRYAQRVKVHSSYTVVPSLSKRLVPEAPLQPQYMTYHVIAYSLGTRPTPFDPCVQKRVRFEDWPESFTSVQAC